MDKISPAVLLQKKSTLTEPHKRMICRRVKNFQTTGSVLVAEGEEWGWGENTKKKKNLHLQLTLLMIGTIPPLNYMP